MALLGAALGLGYDALALLRRALALRRFGTALLDLLFGVLCAAGITLTALILRVNPFRWYVFAGAAAGLAIYFATIGTFVRIVLRFLQNRVGRFNFREGKTPK